VIGAALFLETLTGLMAKGPGFDTTSLISFGVDPRRNGYDNPEAIRLIDGIHDDLRAIPGVQSSAVAQNLLLTGGSWNNPMTIQADERIETDREVYLNAVTPEFFGTLGASIVVGRDFNEHDTLAPNDGGRRVAIVNEAFVERYLDGRNPLGLRVAAGTGPDVVPSIEIIGVMANISYRGVREEREQAYFPLVRGLGLGNNFYVRVRGSSELAMQTIRTLVQKHDPTLPMSYFRTLDEQVSRSLSTERMLAALSGGFGGLALLLSMVGLYGVMSFVVATRTREIGVRLALGATRSSALWLVLRDALTMTAAGIAIALPCAYALGRLIESQLYGVAPTDLWTITAAVSVLGLTALGAALIPARRASAVNPTTALRFE
jgi:predicted permease